ncbi:MAG: BrnT family toxin [Deltaproteobacteria bacterium]|nr:BrnT family toxin [Deltaproteobacteria bacterium]
MSLRFEWDPKKAAANFTKHGVSCEEALTVFSDPLARIFDDAEHSSQEPREVIIGHSAKQRLLLVCFTARETAIRLFSARQATKRERQDYEENVSS